MQYVSSASLFLLLIVSNHGVRRMPFRESISMMERKEYLFQLPKLIDKPCKVTYTTNLSLKVQTQTTPILFIHGFGGNADQFRKNMPYFAEKGHDCYAFDLLGYGYSDKPNPKSFKVNELYNFEIWGNQTCDFISDVIQQPTVLIANSVGGLVALQSAMQRPDLIKGVVLIDISLRLLHIKKQNALIKPFVKLIQTILRESSLGPSFFQQIATPKALKNILNQAYGYSRPGIRSGIEQLLGTASRSVDDETVDLLLQPGLQPGATEVFLDFISYSGGPLPEELLPQVRCPVRILWGEEDPWEPIEMGRSMYAGFPCVDRFAPLSSGGHCPMDQIPQLVNQEILHYLRQYEEVWSLPPVNHSPTIKMTL